MAHRRGDELPGPVRRAGFTGEGLELGEALFEAILASPSGVTFTVDDYDDSWRRVGTEDGRFHLVIPELLDELATLAQGLPSDAEYPFVLSAGERRSFTANTIFRDPSWRKKDLDGAPGQPLDAQRLGVVDAGRSGDDPPSQPRGGREVSRRHGSATSRCPRAGRRSSGRRRHRRGRSGSQRAHGGGGPDWLAGTPWHKHVPARLEPIG